MGFDDPFFGYSFVVRSIVYVVVPAFVAWQVVRLRRALHVFQLEGYKRARFIRWVKARPDRARFLSRRVMKKPLVMTGRAWRILVVATALCALGVLVPSAIAHVRGGAPFDLITAGLTMMVIFFGLPWVLLAADVLITPVQRLINARYERAARAKLDSIRPVVVGVTGSYGKTSVKFAIDTLLGGEPSSFATPGSYNTPMGICRAINEGLEDQHRYLVVEMGAYREGDIAELCRLVRPSVAVLTAIGPVHLERFGSMDAITRAKYELIEGLSADGIAVMNVDDAKVRSLAGVTTHVSVVRYGLDPSGEPDVTVRDHTYSPSGSRFTIVEGRGGELAVQTRLLGEHAVMHVLAAVCVARSLGIPLADLGPRIGALRPVEHRLQLIDGAGGVTVIDDAYNSNPAGAAAAIEVLADMDGNKKVVVTPGIVELGDMQAAANERFGNHAARIADVLVVVGRDNREALVRGAEGPGPTRAEVIVVDSLAAATERLWTLLQPGDVVLFENDLPDQYET